MVSKMDLAGHQALPPSDLARGGRDSRVRFAWWSRGVPSKGSKQICIVTNGEISQSPRVVKEADALAEAGYDVVVVFAQAANWSLVMDQDILDHAKWRGRVVENWPAGVWRRILRAQIAARLGFFRVVSHFSLRSPIAELAYSRYFLEQLWIAIRARADLYIGHNAQSLPVVAWAARLTGAKYGFDFEDFHQGQTPVNEAGSLSSRLLSAIEARHVPGAEHITAASWGITNEVAALHKIVKPTTILNVFNWADRAKLPLAKKISGRRHELSLYWFSQIVSLDRGIQNVIQAMGRVREPVVLHIRGVLNPKVQIELMLLAQNSGVKDRIIFHGLIPPDELLATAAEHDVGLCLETTAVLNRDICITNKMFLYLLAGLTVVASRTRGQSEVLAKCSEAGFLYDSGNIEQLALIIERLARDPGLLAKAKASALAAARDRWNWEQESRTLAASVDDLLKPKSLVKLREMVGASDRDRSQRTARDGQASSDPNRVISSSDDFMRQSDLEIYRCPACRTQLSLQNEPVEQEAEVETGQLTCKACGAAYPIVNAIPRFAPESNYAKSFGLEWSMFPQTQLDESWQSLYKDRFFRTTDFPQSLAGQKVLEVGCGPGNFTGIILGTGARLFSFDLSKAVDGCRQNSCNWTHRHLLSLSQSDVAAPPFALGSFDKIVCLGVIQHCPDPEKAFSSLCRFLKPRGEIVIDCYQKQPFPRSSLAHITKHSLRTITKWMPPRTLLRLVRAGISGAYDVKMALSKTPGVGCIASRDPNR